MMIQKPNRLNRSDLKSMEKAFLFVERFALAAGIATFAIRFLIAIF